MMSKLYKPGMLVIDDEPGIRLLMTRLFGSLYEVQCAGSVDEGLGLLLGSEFDLILMDVDMPGKSGIQGLQEIRLLDAFVRIIIITGSMLPTDRDSLLAQGADAFITKPFKSHELVRLAAHLAATGRSATARP